MKRIIVLPFLLSTILMLASLLNRSGFALLDLTVFSYGYPLQWLVNGISPIPPSSNQWYLYSPINQITTALPIAQLIVDYFFWLGVSLLATTFSSILWNKIQKNQLYKEAGDKKSVTTSVKTIYHW